jgi:hypothetical protein
MAVLVGVIALIGALYLLGTWGGGDPDEQEAGRPTATSEPTAEPEGDGGGEREEQPRRPRNVRLQIVPTGPVSVCLENGEGEVLIGNLTLDAGQDSETFRARRFVVSFGTGAAVMRVGQREFEVSDDAPIGYELRPGRRPRALPEDQRPQCAG